MDYYKKLFELVEKIENKELKRKLIEFLKDPKLTNKNFKYTGSKLKEAPASLNWHHVHDGGLIKHTCIVTSLCLEMSGVIEENYNHKVDRDTLIAGAILHDIGKLFEYKKNENFYESSDISLDHIILGSAELYSRGFPEPVIHLVASHFGEQGTTQPMTIEALLLHHADTISAVIGTSDTHKLMDFFSQ